MAEIRDLGEYLENKGFMPEQPWKKRGTVSCGEKGKMYIAQTVDNTVCCVHRVDGVIIGPKQPKCDYLMLESSLFSVIFLAISAGVGAHAASKNAAAANTIGKSLFFITKKFVKIIIPQNNIK